MCNFERQVVDKTSNSKILDKKKTLENMIPYCGNCARKTKIEGLPKDEYYCDILVNTPMRGVVTSDIDGTQCVVIGIYEPIQHNKSE